MYSTFAAFSGLAFFFGLRTTGFAIVELPFRGARTACEVGPGWSDRICRSPGQTGCFVLCRCSDLVGQNGGSSLKPPPWPPPEPPLQPPPCWPPPEPAPPDGPVAHGSSAG